MCRLQGRNFYESHDTLYCAIFVLFECKYFIWSVYLQATKYSGHLYKSLSLEYKCIVRCYGSQISHCNPVVSVKARYASTVTFDVTRCPVIDLRDNIPLDTQTHRVQLKHGSLRASPPGPGQAGGPGGQGEGLLPHAR